MKSRLALMFVLTATLTLGTVGVARAAPKPPSVTGIVTISAEFSSSRRPHVPHPSSAGQNRDRRHDRPSVTPDRPPSRS